MLLTDDFVYIHMPKTAGTFVTQVLTRVYGEDRVINTDDAGTKHGTCRDIPASHRHLPILSTRRNPYERYVSQYRFGWWKLYPEVFCGEDEMRRLFPHYPDLSFADYLDLAQQRFISHHRGQPTPYVNQRLAPERQIGWHTAVFVRFYARHPVAVFNSLDEDAIKDRRYRSDLFDVRFLDVGNINRELHDFLLERGHPSENVAFILDAERILPKEGGRPAGDRWQSYYTPELLDRVRVRERLLFDLFPEYDLPREAILDVAETP